MEACLTKESAVPQWYVAMKEARIIGGLGVIENDFHDRKDLAPNVCAAYNSFYERYGWEFLCMVQGDGEADMTRMYIHRG